jgi:protein translocase SecG subunit
MTLVLATFGEVTISVLIGFLGLLLIGLVLLQKNRGSGLSGAFGGVGGYSPFGTKTGDFLTWVTVGVTAAFLLMCVVGVYVFVPDYSVEGAAAANAQTPPPGTPTAPIPVSSQPGKPQPIKVTPVTKSQAPGQPAAAPLKPVAPPGGGAVQPSPAAPPSSPPPPGQGK